MKETKKLFVIDNSVDQRPLIEVEVEYTNDGACILDTHGYVVRGAWRDPEVAKKVWDNPQKYIGDSQTLTLIKED